MLRDVGQADGVDIENGGRVGISAHARRIAGDADQIIDADGVGAQQFALDAQNIAVAAAEVQHGFDFGMLLDELAGDLRAHAGAGAGAIRHVDAIDPGGFAELRAFNFLRRVDAARGQNFDERDEFSGG